MKHHPAIGPIDWSASPQLTERALATMLLQDVPGWQRQPSQGDAGVDIVRHFEDGYEIIQVKSHTSALTATQKRRVERSLRQVLADPELDRPVRAWRLLVPVNPTKEAERWFRTLTADAPFPCAWWGRSHVEGLAAAQAHVVDWCFRDGKARLESRLRDLQRAASILDNANVSLRVGEIGPSLQALHEAINREDPHYQYFFGITPEPPEADAEKRRPNLVLAVSHSIPSGGYLTTRVFARHPHATDWCPIPVSFAFNLSPNDVELRQAIDDTFAFGSEVTLPSNVVRDFYVGAPSGLDHRAPEAMMRIAGADDGPFMPFRLRLRAVSPDDTTVAETIIEAQRRTRGNRGVDVHFADLGGAFTVVFRLDFSAPETPLRIRDLALGPAGQPVGRVRDGYALLHALHSPNRLRLLPECGEHELGVLDLHDESGPVDDDYLTVLDALHAIQAHTLIQLLSPEIITGKMARDAVRVARLLTLGTDAGHWREFAIGVPAGELDQWLNGALGGPGLALEQPLHLDLDKQHVDFGKRYVVKLYSARVADVTELRRRASEVEPDEELVVRLLPGDHNRFEAVLGELPSNAA